MPFSPLFSFWNFYVYAVPQIFSALLGFFLFFLPLRLTILSYLSSSSLVLLLLKLSSEIFISVIVFFDSRIFLWFFSIISVSLLLLFLLRHCSGFLQLFVFQTVEGCVSSGTVSANSFCLWIGHAFLFFCMIFFFCRKLNIFNIVICRLWEWNILPLPPILSCLLWVVVVRSFSNSSQLFL